MGLGLTIYILFAVLTSTVYTLFVYRENRLEDDLHRMGYANAHPIAKMLIGFILSSLVWVLITILAPLVYVDIVLGNIKLKEDK